MSEQLLLRLEEYLRNRWFGKYEGVVTSVDDPEQMGRVRVKVPAVMGSQQELGWALPCVPYAGPGRGLLLLPKVEDRVWVEFVGGDPSRPIWTGCFWAKNDAPGAEGELYSPQRLLLKTEAGHRLFLEDDGGVVVLAEGGNQAEIRLSKDGSITVQGTRILLGGSGASEPVPLGTSLINLFNLHTHPTAVGPSGPPVSPATPAQLSSRVFTE